MASAAGISASASTNNARLFANSALNLLLPGNRHGPPLFRGGACNSGVGLCLIDLQSGADVRPNVDVGNVDGNDGEGRLGIKPSRDHLSRDDHGIPERLSVAIARTNR